MDGKRIEKKLLWSHCISNGGLFPPVLQGAFYQVLPGPVNPDPEQAQKRPFYSGVFPLPPG